MDQDLKSYLDQHFSAINRRFEQMEHRFESMEHRFESMEHRFESMEHRFESMEQRFDGQIQQLRQEMNQRFDVVEGEVRSAHVRIEDLQGQVQIVAEGVANCNEKLERHREEVSRKLEICEDLELRVRRLEAGGDLPPTGSLRRSRSR